MFCLLVLMLYIALTMVFDEAFFQCDLMSGTENSNSICIALFEICSIWFFYNNRLNHESRFLKLLVINLLKNTNDLTNFSEIFSCRERIIFKHEIFFFHERKKFPAWIQAWKRNISCMNTSMKQKYFRYEIKLCH